MFIVSGSVIELFFTDKDRYRVHYMQANLQSTEGIGDI